MSEKLCVYTCITGDYDVLHEIDQPEPNVDYLCFTNNKAIKSKTWKIIYIKDNSLNDHLLSRKIKMLGHPIISEKYDTSVWMDASVIWSKKITAFVSKYFKNSTFSAFMHHARTSIQQEAITCLRLHKDSKENIVRTLDFLKKEAFPDNLGLYEMTVFIKKHNDPTVIKTMQIWFDVIKHYSKRDQLSFTYAIWKTNLKVSPIELNVWDNQWFTTAKHTALSENKECCVYYGNPNQSFDINKFFTYSYRHNKNIYSFDAVIPNDTKEIEFNPTNIVGTSYSDIIITPSPSKLVVNDAVLSIFCTTHGTIHAYEDFQKNQKLSFSIKLKSPIQAEIDQLIERQYVENSKLNYQITELNNKIQQVQSQNDQLQLTLQKITDSKSWKIINKIHKAIHLPNKES